MKKQGKVKCPQEEEMKYTLAFHAEGKNSIVCKQDQNEINNEATIN